MPPTTGSTMWRDSPCRAVPGNWESAARFEPAATGVVMKTSTRIIISALVLISLSAAAAALAAPDTGCVLTTDY